MHSLASTNQASSGAVSCMDTNNSSIPPLEECGQDDNDKDELENDNQGHNSDVLRFIHFSYLSASYLILSSALTLSYL